MGFKSYALIIFRAPSPVAGCPGGTSNTMGTPCLRLVLWDWRGLWDSLNPSQFYRFGTLCLGLLDPLGDGSLGVSLSQQGDSGTASDLVGPACPSAVNYKTAC